jgi:alkaline phosphatase
MSENHEDLNQIKISRRNLLKVAGAGALGSLLPASAIAADLKDFPQTKSRGLIFVVGDGMPIGVIRAMHEVSVRFQGMTGTHIYRRMQDAGSAVGYMGTGSLSSIVTDSAPASVAWSTGVKTANRYLAVLPDGRKLKTIMELAKEAGYATGLVTTARVTHATPAAWVSHQMYRDREDDIALDLHKFRPDVLLGGGSRHFSAAKRKDGRDLFKDFQESGYEVIKDKAMLAAAGKTETNKPILGAFNASHISYYIDRLHDAKLGDKEPSLPDMAAVALKRLSANAKGFVLQIEAGRIDHANHLNDAGAAILDMRELDMTLGVLEGYLKQHPETLVIVVSDHGNGGWGINGTGPEYNDATEALKKYLPIKASFEVMVKQMRKKSAPEIGDIMEYFTSYRLTEREVAMIHESMQPGYLPYPGDFVNMPEALIGRTLAHSEYAKNEKGDVQARVRRGNIGFTSTNHTAEDQLLLAYGAKAQQLGLGRYIDNTYVFTAMCKYLGLSYQNPAMTEEEARPFIKTASAAEWQQHLRLHVA